LNPEWEPTHWAVAIVLTYPAETWRTLPPSNLAAEGVKVEAASFAIEPVVRPEACSVIERIDGTARMLPLLPKAFDMLPSGGGAGWWLSWKRFGSSREWQCATMRGSVMGAGAPLVVFVGIVFGLV